MHEYALVYWDRDTAATDLQNYEFAGGEVTYQEVLMDDFKKSKKNKLRGLEIGDFIQRGFIVFKYTREPMFVTFYLIEDLNGLRWIKQYSDLRPTLTKL